REENAVEAVSFAVAAGEMIAVIGPNGAGKSTLIKTMMGLLQAQAGTVNVADGVRLGYVPQHESVDWTFPVTVRDAVMMGRARQIGLFRWPGRADWRAVDAALERVELADLAKRQIGELSGGQRRRVFIARALGQDARVLLLDEPFSGVDASVEHNLMDTLDALNRDGLTIVLTTHDLNLAFSRFNRVLALNRRLIAYGAPAEVYRPEVLAALYGGRFATWDAGSQTMVFVDDHHCEGC
ncbi:MAG TPA: metal ABC transporter ATP-binding protein, partial [Phototrophicaceae bacterium]|nr:metal ABC transporter ATP-binding protein [Phototrophicaceae bacterium]